MERHVLCTRCCEKDLCNDGCGDVHVGKEMPQSDNRVLTWFKLEGGGHDFS